MKITPVASPAAIPPQGTPEHIRTAKAVAAFNKGVSSYDKPAAQSPVLNQNAISSEELGAIMPKQDNNEIDSETEVIETSQAAEVTEEVAAEEPPPKQDPALSRQFAQLARQEKALRLKAQQQDVALKAREAALAAREAELSSKYQAPDMAKYIPRDRLQKDALTVLAEAGVSYEDLTNQLLTHQPVNPQVQAMLDRQQAEIDRLKAEAEEGKKSVSASQQAQYDAAVKQIRTDAARLVAKDPNFETIKATNSANDVVDLILKTYEKDGILLSVEEAAEEVENYLVEEYSKLANLSKIQKRLQPKPEQVATLQAKQSQTPKPAQSQPMKTLTNASSSQRQLSAKERAILAFKGELK